MSLDGGLTLVRHYRSFKYLLESFFPGGHAVADGVFVEAGRQARIVRARSRAWEFLGGAGIHARLAAGKLDDFTREIVPRGRAPARDVVRAVRAVFGHTEQLGREILDKRRAAVLIIDHFQLIAFGSQLEEWSRQSWRRRDRTATRCAR